MKIIHQNLYLHIKSPQFYACNSHELGIPSTFFIVYQNLIGFCFRQQQGRNRNHNDQTLDRELIETGAVWFRGNSTDLLFHTSSDGTSHRKRSVRMHLIFSESNIWLQRSTSVDDDFNEITTQQNVLAPYP